MRTSIAFLLVIIWCYSASAQWQCEGLGQPPGGPCSASWDCCFVKCMETTCENEVCVVLARNPPSRCWAPIGNNCCSDADCCPNFCSTASCVQGTCVGSLCKGDGSSCQLDCECCSGECNQDLLGTCAPATPSSEERMIRRCSGNSCVSENAGNATNTRSEMCCPSNKKAVCSANGSSCEDPGVDFACSGSSCSLFGGHAGNQCSVCCPAGKPAYCGPMKDENGDCKYDCMCGKPDKLKCATKASVTPGSSMCPGNIALIVVATVSTSVIAVAAVVMTIKYYRKNYSYERI